MTPNPNRDPVVLAARQDTVGHYLTRPWSWRGAVAVLLLLAGYVASVGTRAIPLDGHEVFVVQTAQEMNTRDDFIVPYFNGEPRLTKPPLSYWLTWLVASITGDPGHIPPWQGRVPSIAAGIGLVAAAVWLGALLFDRATGLLAGLLLTLSAGFFSYTHDARPDLLYAFWCALGYTAFAAAGALAVVFCVALILRRGRTITPLGDLAALGVMYGIALAAVSDTRWLWSQDRFERPRLARIARAAAYPDTPIVSWGINANGYVYYVGRKITVVARLRGDALTRSPRFNVDDP